MRRMLAMCLVFDEQSSAVEERTLTNRNYWRNQGDDVHCEGKALFAYFSSAVRGSLTAGTAAEIDGAIAAWCDSTLGVRDPSTMAALRADMLPASAFQAPDDATNGPRETAHSCPRLFAGCYYEWTALERVCALDDRSIRALGWSPLRETIGIVTRLQRARSDFQAELWESLDKNAPDDAPSLAHTVRALQTAKRRSASVTTSKGKAIHRVLSSLAQSKTG